MRRKYRVVDVFSKQPLLGNPVAVVLECAGLGTAEMQSIARWTNLSETTFVLPPESPDADYRLRIFTPDRELPFAGHPTLGSAHAVIEAGICDPARGVVIQECGAGRIPVSLEGCDGDRQLVLQMPPARHWPLGTDEIEELAAILGCDVCAQPTPSLVDVGPIWMVAQIEDRPTLMGLQPDFARLAAFERLLGATGLSLFATTDDGIETRSFAPSCGVNEDPVCGSGNGSIADFRMRAGQIAPGDSYVARQGRMTGRDGIVSVLTEADGTIFVGGSCVTTVEGTLLP